jgi:hypothetical protein
MIGTRGKIPAQRTRRALIGSGGAAESEIDPAAIQRLQRAKLFCDHQRCMVRQHDAARPDADGAGAARDIADHYRGRGAGNARHVVMFGEPEPLVIPAFGVLREIERVAEGLGRIAALVDRRQIQNGKRYHLRNPSGFWRQFSVLPALSE